MSDTETQPAASFDIWAFIKEFVASAEDSFRSLPKEHQTAARTEILAALSNPPKTVAAAPSQYVQDERIPTPTPTAAESSSLPVQPNPSSL